MDCTTPGCHRPPAYDTGSGWTCAEHAGLAPSDLGQAPACWRYDPSDRSIYLWAPYESLNGPDDPPGRLWPILKLKLATGATMTVGAGTHAAGQVFWDSLRATLPADLGAQVRDLEAQVAVVSARYAELVGLVEALEARAAQAAAAASPVDPRGQLWVPPGRN